MDSIRLLVMVRVRSLGQDGSIGTSLYDTPPSSAMPRPAHWSSSTGPCSDRIAGPGRCSGTEPSGRWVCPACYDRSVRVLSSVQYGLIGASLRDTPPSSACPTPHWTTGPCSDRIAGPGRCSGTEPSGRRVCPACCDRSVRVLWQIQYGLMGQACPSLLMP